MRPLLSHALGAVSSSHSALHWPEGTSKAEKSHQSISCEEERGVYKHTTLEPACPSHPLRQAPLSLPVSLSQALEARDRRQSPDGSKLSWFQWSSQWPILQYFILSRTLPPARYSFVSAFPSLGFCITLCVKAKNSVGKVRGRAWNIRNPP